MSIRRIAGIFSYELKGVQGRFSIKSNIVDIADIICINGYKRMFCILDKDYCYSLQIECSNIETKAYRALVIAPFGVGLAFIPEKTILIDLRFKTEEEMNSEIDEIEEKQKLLDELAQKIRNKLLNE